MSTWNHLDIGDAIATLNNEGRRSQADAVKALLAERDQLADLLDRIAALASKTAAEFEAAGAEIPARLMRAVVAQATALDGDED